MKKLRGIRSVHRPVNNPHDDKPQVCLFISSLIVFHLMILLISRTPAHRGAVHLCLAQETEPINLAKGQR